MSTPPVASDAGGADGGGQPTPRASQRTALEIVVVISILAIGALGIAAGAGADRRPATAIPRRPAASREPARAAGSLSPAASSRDSWASRSLGRAEPITLPATDGAATPGLELSPFVGNRSDRFAFTAVGATETERREANEAAETAEQEISRLAEKVAEGALPKAEAVARMEQARQLRNQTLVAIFGSERADVLAAVEIVNGVEADSDDVDDLVLPSPATDSADSPR